jgi:RNA polymerase sigma factor (sigma-70 family)
VVLKKKKAKAERTLGERKSADDFILSQMKRYPPLSPRAEIKLFKRIKWRHRKSDGLAQEAVARRKLRRTLARRKMLLHNQQYVLKIAASYRKRDMSLDLCDLFQEGMLGLDHAIDKFDLSRGYKFSTYATWWIRESVTRAIKSKALTIRLPARVYDISAKIRWECSRIQKEEKRKATSSELAEKFGMDQKEVEMYKGYRFEFDSLNRKVYGDNGEKVTLGEILEDDRKPTPEHDSMEQEDKDYVRHCVNKLPRKMAIFITKLYGLKTGCPRSRSEIAMEYLISEHEAHATEKRVLKKLREIVDRSRLNCLEQKAQKEDADN